VLGSGAPANAVTTQAAPHRAGVVVVHADGSVASRCVGFQEESISGYDLLVRGGFAPRSEVTSMGASVCSLEGQGCSAEQDCFCQCQSSSCVYWTYWDFGPEGWRYLNLGAANTRVSDGAVQGWVWGESKPNSAAELSPPALAFTDICNSDAAVYGVSEAISTSTPAESMGDPWMVALVVGAPLVLGAGWWLLQRRRVVQP
jgi:hypothetical protein